MKSVSAVPPRGPKAAVVYAVPPRLGEALLSEARLARAAVWL